MDYADKHDSDGSSDPASLRALALDTGANPPAEPPVDRVSNFEVPVRRVPLRFKLIVGAALAGCVAILTLATIQTRNAGFPQAPAVNAVAVPEAPAVPPMTAAPLHASEPPPPPTGITKEKPATPAVAHAPETTTISLGPSVPKGTPLTVDGKRAKSSSVVVTCGKHTVAVGGEKAKPVEAACGKPFVVEKAKADGKKKQAPKHPAPAHAAKRH